MLLAAERIPLSHPSVMASLVPMARMLAQETGLGTASTATSAQEPSSARCGASCYH